MAADKCSDFFNPAMSHSETVASVKIVNLGGPNIRSDRKPFLLDYYSEAIGKVQSFILDRTNLVFPTMPVKIRIHPVFNHPGSAACLNTRRDLLDITIPYRWKGEIKVEDTWKMVKSEPSETLPMFYHEYGHAVFRSNVEVVNSELGNFYRKDARLDQITRESLALLKIYDATKDKSLKKQYEEQLELFYKEFNSLDKEVNTKNKKRHILVGVDELFADLIAVLVSQKNTAMSDSVTINTQYGTSIHRDAHYRDFSNSSNDLKSWEESWSVHNVFSPTRYYLYNKYLKHSEYLAGPRSGNFLQQILLALHSFSNDPRLNDPSISPTEVNKVLIEHLVDIK